MSSNRRSRVIFGACAIVYACGGDQTNTVCAPNETLCGASCAALSKDPANCGACGTTCSSGKACVAGSCSSNCPAAQSLCVFDGGAAYCANVQSDNENCGACRNACGASLVCADAVCSNTCASDQTYCAIDGGAPYCAQTATDSSNCGFCGSACTQGETCVAGKCQIACSPGLTQCGVECVDTTTDLSNCGSCATTCGGRCVASECVVVLSASGSGGYLGSVFGVRVDSGSVFWTASDGVYRVQVAKPLYTYTLHSFSSTEQYGYGLDEHNGSVAWSDNCNPCAVGVDSTVTSFENGPDAVALDSTNVYWRTTSGSVRHAPIGGGTIVTMILGQSTGSLLTDGTLVYWDNTNTDVIVSMPVDSVDAGSLNVLVSGETGIHDLIMDSTNFYWRTSDIRRAPIGGGTGTTIVSTGLYTGALAVDGTNVYYVDNNGLEKVPIGGGTVTKLVDTSVYNKRSYGVAVDAKSVYFTVVAPNVGDPTVYMVTPK